MNPSENPNQSMSQKGTEFLDQQKSQQTMSMLNHTPQSSESIFDKLGRIDSERLANRRLAAMDAVGGDALGRVDQSNKKCSKAMTLLPESFEPGEHDVICGRGRNIWNSIGNINFRSKVESRVEEYSAAATKLDKSAILSSIVVEIRKGSPNGGFVRKDAKTGRWFEVGDFLAREKVSQSFRDALSDSYRSSNKTKRKRRIEEQAKTAEINSQLQQEALEQLQSGRTDKNLYEIICQQQSMLQQQQPKRRRSSRSSPSIREEHFPSSDFMMRSEAENNRFSDMNTAPGGYIGLRPSLLDSQPSFGRRQLQDSNLGAEGIQSQCYNDNAFEPLPIRPQEMNRNSGVGQYMQGSSMPPLLGSKQLGLEVSTGSEEDRRLLDSLMIALANADQEERYDDPFEPVPLPPSNDTTKDLEPISFN